MSLFPLRTKNPQLLGLALAYKRVARGIKFFDAHAPKDWWRHFFVLYPSGRWGCLAHDSYDNECALALAFSSDPSYANQYGYVTYASVLDRLAVEPIRDMRGLFPFFQRRHGFADDETLGDIVNERAGKPKNPRHIVSGTMLDRAWADLAFKVHYDRQHPLRHPTTALDRQFGEVELRDTPRRSFFDWLFARPIATA